MSVPFARAPRSSVMLASTIEAAAAATATCARLISQTPAATWVSAGAVGVSAGVPARTARAAVRPARSRRTTTRSIRGRVAWAAPMASVSWPGVDLEVVAADERLAGVHPDAHRGRARLRDGELVAGRDDAVADDRAEDLGPGVAGVDPVAAGAVEEPGSLGHRALLQAALMM